MCAGKDETSGCEKCQDNNSKGGERRDDENIFEFAWTLKVLRKREENPVSEKGRRSYEAFLELSLSDKCNVDEHPRQCLMSCSPLGLLNTECG